MPETAGATLEQVRSGGCESQGNHGMGASLKVKATLSQIEAFFHRHEHPTLPSSDPAVAARAGGETRPSLSLNDPIAQPLLPRGV